MERIERTSKMNKEKKAQKKKRTSWKQNGKEIENK